VFVVILFLTISFTVISVQNSRYILYYPKMYFYTVNAFSCPLQYILYFVIKMFK